MKRTVVLVLAFALSCGILASWLGPKMIGYWYAPPAESGAPIAFNCTGAVMWAMNRLVWTQLIGSAVGAIFGLALGIFLRGGKPTAPPVRSPPAPKTT
jgi:hypothetical protein